jgi:D-aminopeptidase
MPKILVKAWPRVECVDEGDVGVGAEDVIEAHRVKVLAEASFWSC